MSDSSLVDIASWYMSLAQSKELGDPGASANRSSQTFASSAPVLMQTEYLSTFYLTGQESGDNSAQMNVSAPSYLTPVLLGAYGNNSTIFHNSTPSVANADSRIAVANVTSISVTNDPRRIGDARPSVVRIAEWDGYVEDIYNDYFVARMHGLHGLGVVGAEEDAEIPISDVDSGDRDLLVIGGFFRLMIADEVPRVGYKKRYTTVQFRRMPAYSKRELDAAKQEADVLINAFQLDETSRSAST